MKTHLSDGSSEDRSVARSLYLGIEKLSPLRLQWQKLRNTCNFSKGVRPCTYVKICLSLHNTGGTSTPGGDFLRLPPRLLPFHKDVYETAGWPIWAKMANSGKAGRAITPSGM